MNKVNLTKYGFVRSPEDDFSDDGNRFTCYKVGRIRVSKCVSNGEYFIAARLDGNLNYNEYSKLAHYNSLDRLNGVYSGSITDADLYQLFADCQEYEKEYIAEEAKIVWPTVEEIAAKRKQIRELRISEFEEITKLATVDKIMSLKNYEATSFKDSYITLKNNAYPIGTDEEYGKQLYKTAYSRSYVSSNYELQESYYYKNLKKYLQVI